LIIKFPYTFLCTKPIKQDSAFCFRHVLKIPEGLGVQKVIFLQNVNMRNFVPEAWFRRKCVGTVQAHVFSRTWYIKSPRAAIQKHQLHFLYLFSTHFFCSKWVCIFPLHKVYGQRPIFIFGISKPNTWFRRKCIDQNWPCTKCPGASQQPQKSPLSDFVRTLGTAESGWFVCWRIYSAI